MIYFFAFTFRYWFVRSSLAAFRLRWDLAAYRSLWFGSKHCKRRLRLTATLVPRCGNTNRGDGGDEALPGRLCSAFWTFLYAAR